MSAKLINNWKDCWEKTLSKNPYRKETSQPIHNAIQSTGLYMERAST